MLNSSELFFIAAFNNSFNGNSNTSNLPRNNHKPPSYSVSLLIVPSVNVIESLFGIFNNYLLFDICKNNPHFNSGSVWMLLVAVWNSVALVFQAFPRVYHRLWVRLQNFWLSSMQGDKFNHVGYLHGHERSPGCPSCGLCSSYQKRIGRQLNL